MKYIFLLLIFLISCQEGLEPKLIPNSYIGGIITFKGGSNSWPDTVTALRVVAFKNDNPEVFFEEIAQGNAYFDFASLPIRVDSIEWKINIPDPPVELKYIAVALQPTSDILKQIVVGVYTISGDKTLPSWVKVDIGDTFNNLNIEVDFDDLPPQPFDN
jgi:hypothetical protein